MATLLKFFLVPFLFVSAYVASDMKVPGDSCFAYDTCKESAFMRTCACAADCYQYGTCCLDATSFHLMNENETRFQCHRQDMMFSVFVKRRCADDFKGDSEVMYACNAGNDTKADFLSEMVVSRNKTNTAYWNLNCAICNHEELANLVYWQVQVSCPAKHEGKDINLDYIHEHLVFKKARDSWGLNFDSDFVPCSHSFLQPVGLAGKLKGCPPNEVISTCPPDYHDKETAEKCSLYYGEREEKGTNKYFKNVHCALCNDASVKNLSCFGLNYPPTLRSDFSTVKVILNSGTWTTNISTGDYKCARNMIYDPFQSKCVQSKTSQNSVKKPDLHWNTKIQNAAGMNQLSYLLFLFVMAIFSRKSM